MIPLEPEKSESVRGRSEDVLPSPLVQAAEVARTYLSNTGQARKNHSMAVFAELAERITERGPQGLPCEFTAQNLKAGVAQDAQKEPSGWLSPVWTKAVELEPQWQEGLTETARVLGYGFIPKLTKVPGSPALYSLKPVALEPSVAEASVPELGAGGIRYTPEAVAAPAAWLNATLKAGVVRWTGGLRWSVVGVVLACLAMTALLVWAGFTVGIRNTKPLSMSDLWGTLAMVAAIGSLLQLYRFFDDLFDMSIVMAPSFLTSLSAENVTLELRRRSVDDRVGELAFVRYTGSCPRCEGSVEIHPGGKEFVGRLVGRCKRSPREHVYSFDHALRTGLPVR